MKSGHWIETIRFSFMFRSVRVGAPRALLGISFGLLFIALVLAWAWPATAEVVVWYQYQYNDFPETIAPDVISGSQFNAAYSALKGDSDTTGNPLPSYVADEWISETNYLECAVNLRDGFALTLDDVVFDYRSEFAEGYAGPTAYQVWAGPATSAMVCLSNGWQPLTRDDAWHAAVTARNDGLISGELPGTVYFRICGRGAEQADAYWWVDNVAVHGTLATNYPRIWQIAASNEDVWLTLTIPSSATTYRIERAVDVSGATWTTLGSFSRQAGWTNWTDSVALTNAALFYRVVGP